MPTLETERLTLRTWKLDDFEQFAAIHADPEVMQFISIDGRPLSRYFAWQGFCAVIGHWQLRGYGMFAVIERTSGELVGRVGPWYPEGWPEFEVGWTIGRKFWGQGYATEAAAKCAEFAFTELNRTHLVSFIDPKNVRSIRVAERLGERFQHETALPHVPDRPVLQYGMSKEDWRRAG